jgi:hypothetical protein
MKIPAALLILIVASEYLHASAGPPPFTNGSPLVSGVDGSYQATARGRNLTGVFRFTYSGGRQTSNPRLPTGNSVASLLTDPYNDYVFFVEGVVFRGLVQANINVNSVAGVLDNGGANVPNFGGESNPTPTPTASPTASPSPAASPSPTPQQSSTQNFLRINAFMNGFFNGTIDQNSPYASFHGKGEVTVTAFTDTSDGGFAPTGFFEVKFRFSGVRNATGTTTSSTTTTTTSGSTTSG